MIINFETNTNRKAKFCKPYEFKVVVFMEDKVEVNSVMLTSPVIVFDAEDVQDSVKSKFSEKLLKLERRKSLIW